jgi:hypothetical protein
MADVSHRLLVEIDSVLGEIVDNDRAGWGEEPIVECLYCGEYDSVRDDEGNDHVGSHEANCAILRGRRLREMLKAVLDAS